MRASSSGYRSLDTFASVTVVLKHLCSPLFGDFGGLKMASRVVGLRIDCNMVFFFPPPADISQLQDHKL